MKSALKEYMKPSTRQALGNLPTTHQNCIAATEVRNEKGKIIVPGIARPGKTARDRANGYAKA